MNGILKTLISVAFLQTITANVSLEEDDGNAIYTIEGKVYPPDNSDPSHNNWNAMTRVNVNGGEAIGFVREDGSFTVFNVTSGSYLIDVSNPDFTYEPIRVEINSKGKYRARRVNFIQTSQVLQVPYPLKLKPILKTRYFQQREQWRVTDLLFNPMVLMMVLPFLVIMVLPKMMSDPETKKDMDALNTGLTQNFQMPEMSELMTNWFPSANVAGSSVAKKVEKKVKKRQ